MKNLKVENPAGLPTISWAELKEKFEANELKDKAHRDVGDLKQSILSIGFVIPLCLWLEGKYITDGAGRLMALKMLEYEGYEIPDLPYFPINAKNKKEAKRITLAISSQYGDITPESAGAFMLQMDEIDLSFINLPGLDLAEIDWRPEHNNVEIEEDEIPEIPKKPVSKYGDRYALGIHVLMCGDATSRDDVQKLVGNHKADIIFTDPPYGINVVKNNKVGADFGVAKKGKYNPVIADGTTETARKAFDVIKDFAPKQIIWGGNYFTDFLPKSSGLIVWDKRVDSGIKNTFADGEVAWCSFHTPIRIYRQLWNGMIREGEKQKRVHPTQKPTRLTGNIINDFTRQGAVVLDVFGGSGTTLIACEQIGRKCLTMELDPGYVDVIVERWENLTGKKAKKIA